MLQSLNTSVIKVLLMSNKSAAPKGLWLLYAVFYYQIFSPTGFAQNKELWVVAP
jgi:hypothetical protein